MKRYTTKQITIPVIKEIRTLSDGSKLTMTDSITKHLRIEGDSNVTGMMGNKVVSFGKVVGGKIEYQYPKALQVAHEAYKEFKKPNEQKAIEAILHNEPVLKENAA